MDFVKQHSNILAPLGALTASYVALKFLISLWRGFKVYFLARLLGLSADLKSFGQWAVVTGATDGIGKGYAHELARKGINVMLISRSPEKLNDVAKEIESKYGVKTKTLGIDFASDDSIYKTISKELAGMDIGVLVNNVGMSYEHPEYYTEVKDEVVPKLLTVNVHSVAMMTKIVLPSMAEKRKGAIINIASASGKHPVPLLSLYSGTKAFVNFFTTAIGHEYASRGVIIQCVFPFFVATKMSRIRRSSFFVPDPYSYARSALATVGVEDSTFGCLSHALQGWIWNVTPRPLVNFGLQKFFKFARKVLKTREERHPKRSDVKQD